MRGTRAGEFSPNSLASRPIAVLSSVTDWATTRRIDPGSLRRDSDRHRRGSGVISSHQEKRRRWKERGATR